MDGIITIEDVLEELIQEEIEDETDLMVRKASVLLSLPSSSFSFILSLFLLLFSSCQNQQGTIQRYDTSLGPALEPYPPSISELERELLIP